MYLQCKYILSKINYYANFSRAWPYKFLIERPARPFCQIFYILTMLGVNTRTRYRMKALAAKDTPRTGENIRVYCWLAGGSGVIISQPEKHLWTLAAFYGVLLRVQPKGVRNFCTPLATGPSRSVSTASWLKRCFSGSRQGNARHPMGYFAILGTVRPLSIAVLRHLLWRRTVFPSGEMRVFPAAHKNAPETAV